MFRSNVDVEILEAHSDRECAFYADYLVQQIRGTAIKNLQGRNVEERIKNINAELDLLIRKKKAPKNFAAQMTTAFNSTQLPHSYFRWVDKNDTRLCNWLWCYLKKHTNSNSQDTETQHIPHPLLSRLSSQPFLIEKDNNTDRYADILNAFYFGELTAKHQQDVLEFLKSLWFEVEADTSVTDWLGDSNVIQWQWAYSYLQNVKTRPLPMAWTSHRDNEKREIVITTIDLADNLDRKALLIDKMKKAWSQKKFREKSNGKKPYSISMTQNTKQKLNALAEEHEMKINEMIELLIQNEYNKRA
ncbi:hypothetical protein [Marinomonas sp. THO17]|uniref:hypothetical protein n=1 Tax=Marinomonas sp. THO17 TaxID=3149048 RepID=UPI00336BC3FE